MSLFGAKTGTLSGVSSATYVAGNTLLVGLTENVHENTPYPGTLGAYVEATCATANITVKGVWQVSDDNSTWVDCAPTPNNAAAVAIATGTAAKVTLAIPAPGEVHGYNFARLSLLTGATGGTTGDVYKIGYSFAKWGGY